MSVASVQTRPRVLGRYALHAEIAAGGMATVHVGRLLGPVGFARTVAIKCLHPHFAKDPEFVSMFVDEARLAARVSHPNVVATHDIVSEGGELFLVMEYVAGDSLAHLLRHAPESRVPPPLAIAIVMGALHGLHAAHEAVNERGQPLCIVHRDVSPQNVLVGADGVARVLDFGVAKAASRMQTTREGQLKGKLGYMAPEQLDGEQVDRRADVYAAGVVLWECLTGKRLFQGKDGAPILNSSQRRIVLAPSQAADGVPDTLDAIVRRAVAFRAAERFASAKEMAIALEQTGLAASQREVGEWVERTARYALEERSGIIAALERADEDGSVASTAVPHRSRPDEKTRAAGPAALHGRETSSGVVRRLPDLTSKANRRRWAAGAVLVLGGGALYGVWPRTSDAGPPIVVHGAIAAEAPPVAPLAPPVVTSVAPPEVAPIVGERRRTSKGGSGKASCSPPYTVDEDGVRVPKRHCL